MKNRGPRMAVADRATTVARCTDDAAIRLPRRSTWLASVAAGGSIAGLLAPDRIYGQETAALADAATAQDLATVVLVAPLLIVLGVRASGGSLPAYLGWLGCLAFTAYIYAIYAFSIQVGPLFLPWVAVLGLSGFTLVGGLSTLDVAAVGRRFTGRAFALLWLSEIVPDLSAGEPSSSASTRRVPTNPVHVLDLAFFLPALWRTLRTTAPSDAPAATLPTAEPATARTR